MKDVVLYVFFCALYFVLALRFIPIDMVGAVGWGATGGSVEVLSWRTLGEVFLLIAGVATIARWTVIAFKPSPQRLKPGQKIVGVEEPEADRVIDVLSPVALQREVKKPKLRKKTRQF
jgi:hypothetical protein